MRWQQHIAHTFLFEGVSSEETARMLAQLSAPVVYERGEKVYTPTAYRHALGVVVEGELAVHRPTDEHTRQQLLVVENVFGAAALFGGEDYVTEIVAAKRSRVVFISEEQLTEWFAAVPRVAQNYIRFLTGRIRFLNAQLRGCADGGAVERLTRYLLDHAHDGVVERGVPWSTLADQLGMGRSSLYRARDTLRAEGRLVEREGIWYIQNV